MQQLLEHINLQCHPQQLRTLLCPIFAKSQQEQELFYERFERLYPLFTQINAPPVDHASTLGQSSVVSDPVLSQRSGDKVFKRLRQLFTRIKTAPQFMLWSN